MRCHQYYHGSSCPGLFGVTKAGKTPPAPAILGIPSPPILLSSRGCLWVKEGRTYPCSCHALVGGYSKQWCSILGLGWGQWLWQAGPSFQYLLPHQRWWHLAGRQEEGALGSPLLLLSPPDPGAGASPGLLLPISSWGLQGVAAHSTSSLFPSPSIKFPTLI